MNLKKLLLEFSKEKIFDEQTINKAFNTLEPLRNLIVLMFHDNIIDSLEKREKNEFYADSFNKILPYFPKDDQKIIKKIIPRLTNPYIMESLDTDLTEIKLFLIKYKKINRWLDDFSSYVTNKTHTIYSRLIFDTTENISQNALKFNIQELDYAIGLLHTIHTDIVELNIGGSKIDRSFQVVISAYTQLLHNFQSKLNKE